MKNFNTLMTFQKEEVVKEVIKNKKKKRVYYRGEYIRVRNGKEQVIKECFVGGREEYDKKFTKSPRELYCEETGENIRFTTLYHYTGGKAKFYNEVQFIYNEFYSKNYYSICLVPFLGGGSDFLNISPKIIGKVKTFVVNDWNPTLIGVWKNIRDNSEELKKSVLELVEMKPTKQEYVKDYFNLLVDECKKIELEKDYENIQLSAMFLILNNNSKNGVYEWNDNLRISVFSPTTMKRNNDFNITKKIDYVKWYMDKYENFIVENISYDELIEKYGSLETLIISDPPYVKEKLEFDENSKLERTKISYGFTGFDHNKCSEVFTTKLKGSSLIYHNYWNVDLVKQFQENGFTTKKYDKKNPLSKNEDGTTKDCVELIVYTNTRMKKKEFKSVNNTEFRPFRKEEKVS